MGCQADYSNEDLRLMKSVREETIKEAIEVIEDMLLQYKGDSVIEMTLKELTQKLSQLNIQDEINRKIITTPQEHLDNTQKLNRVERRRIVQIRR